MPLTQAFVPAKTIDEVIHQLEQLIEDCIQRKDRIGYFAALYHKVTMRVKEGILNNEFEDGPRMERLDVIFANRYLTAAHQVRNQQKASASWEAAFNACKRRSPLVLQHLLLGMNAHINYDLGVAAVDTAGTNDIRTIRSDFNAINTIIGSLIFEVLTEINRVSPCSLCSDCTPATIPSSSSSALPMPAMAPGYLRKTSSPSWPGHLPAPLV
jgi:hypothetical protein